MKTTALATSTIGFLLAGPATALNTLMPPVSDCSVTATAGHTYCACANSLTAGISTATSSSTLYSVCAASPSPTVASSKLPDDPASDLSALLSAVRVVADINNATASAGSSTTLPTTRSITQATTQPTIQVTAQATISSLTTQNITITSLSSSPSYSQTSFGYSATTNIPTTTSTTTTHGGAAATADGRGTLWALAGVGGLIMAFA